MRNIIQLKKAKDIQEDTYVLTPQNGTGLLLAEKVGRVEKFVDGSGKPMIELTTQTGIERYRNHVVSPNQLVAIVF